MFKEDDWVVRPSNKAFYLTRCVGKSNGEQCSKLKTPWFDEDNKMLVENWELSTKPTEVVQWIPKVGDHVGLNKHFDNTYMNPLNKGGIVIAVNDYAPHTCEVTIKFSEPEPFIKCTLSLKELIPGWYIPYEEELPKITLTITPNETSILEEITQFLKDVQLENQVKRRRIEHLESRLDDTLEILLDNDEYDLAREDGLLIDG